MIKDIDITLWIKHPAKRAAYYYLINLFYNYDLAFIKYEIIEVISDFKDYDRQTLFNKLYEWLKDYEIYKEEYTIKEYYEEFIILALENDL